MEKISNVVIILLFLGIGLAGGYFLFGGQGMQFGGYEQGTFNKMADLQTVSTSTGSYCSACAVKLIDRDVDRQYAIVTNPSDTGIYIVATSTELGYNFDGSNSAETGATSTITTLDGVYIAAGGSYEILPENMVYGELWATSTAASKTINVSYK